MSEFYNKLQEVIKLLGEYDKTAKELGWMMTIKNSSKKDITLGLWSQTSTPIKPRITNQSLKKTKKKPIIEFNKSITYSGKITNALELFVNNDYVIERVNESFYTDYLLSNESIGPGFELKKFSIQKQEPIERLGKIIEREKEPTLYLTASLDFDKEVKQELRPILKGLNSIIEEIN
jgi:hypothetical protein